MDMCLRDLPGRGHQQGPGRSAVVSVKTSWSICNGNTKLRSTFHIDVIIPHTEIGNSAEDWDLP